MKALSTPLVHLCSPRIARPLHLRSPFAITQNYSYGGREGNIQTLDMLERFLAVLDEAGAAGRVPSWSECVCWEPVDGVPPSPLPREIASSDFLYASC